MYRTSPIRARSGRITFFTDIVEKTRFPLTEARCLKNVWHWEYHEMDKHGPYSLKIDGTDTEFDRIWFFYTFECVS